MIVVDTNVIAYLMIPGPRTSVARAAFVKDPEWAAPYLWRSEFRDILALYLRKGLIEFDVALDLASEAERLMGGREYFVESKDVLQVASSTRLSAYDAEFVALANQLKLPLVTTDSGIVTACPKTATMVEDYCAA